jgi:hypothetical protein
MTLSVSAGTTRLPVIRGTPENICSPRVLLIVIQSSHSAPLSLGWTVEGRDANAGHDSNRFNIESIYLGHWVCPARRAYPQVSRSNWPDRRCCTTIPGSYRLIILVERCCAYLDHSKGELHSTPALKVASRIAKRKLLMGRDGDKNAHRDHGNRLDKIECEANGGDDIRLFKKQVNRTLTDSREKYRGC